MQFQTPDSSHVPFTLIADDQALQRAAMEWRKAPELAIDLEMEANFHHYGVTLALVQISDRKHIWLVDMLAIDNPEPIVTIFQDPSILKVFHDVSFDFRVLQGALKCNPKNIIDTKIAAQLAGRPAVSLAALLKEEFGVQKEEKWQKADWLRRPLPPGMLSYAAKDVLLLLKLKDLLLAQLETLGRTAWLDEECRIIESSSYAVEPRTFLDIKGVALLTDSERGHAKAIYDVREELAAHLDRPTFFVIPDRILLALAHQPPQTLQAWHSLHGVHPAVKAAASRFHSALQKAKPIPKVRSPHERPKRMTEAQKTRLEDLLSLRDRTGDRLGIEHSLVLTREQATALAVGADPLQTLKRWQQSVLGPLP